ncbi:hypothetical protein [Acidovorax carolinensis]|uniref:hypothetical protein n=1 Tax=Acidovorax carolinensis TaxID=553814 RepID=UPI001F1EDA8D|nr:hypothetical protein [Acidovorax carolinensis]
MTPAWGALLRTSWIALYHPLKWVEWGWKYGDVHVLRGAVQMLFVIAGLSEACAMIVGGIVGHRLSRYTKGMDGLHGTAHFAEREDVDKTGFIDALGHKADGVIVGSVMLDSKGKVIHPHHPKFQGRYESITTRGTWRERFRKIPKRDGNKRPMFRIAKKVVKKVELLRDGGNTHLFGFCQPFGQGRWHGDSDIADLAPLGHGQRPEGGGLRPVCGFSPSGGPGHHQVRACWH